MNIAIAGLIQQAGYARWKGHDMQTRAYDNAEQGIDRVVRSVLSWEACEQAARELKTRALMKALAQRETAKAEDMMRPPSSAPRSTSTRCTHSGPDRTASDCFLPAWKQHRQTMERVMRQRSRQ